MAKQLFTFEQLTESEKLIFSECDDNRATLIQTAKLVLDNGSYENWLHDKINECQKIISGAFFIIEAWYSGDIINDPISPVDYCIAQKWIVIYESEIENLSQQIPTTSFDECITAADNERKAMIKKVLHDLIDGKRGKWVALVIRYGISYGLITKPKHSEVVREFGEVIGESNYKKYLSPTTTPNINVAKELAAIEKRISELMS